MLLFSNKNDELYLLITRENCLNSKRAEDLLDSEEVSYIKMDYKEVLSEWIDIIKGKGVLSYPVVFKLEGSFDDIYKKFKHT